jgi:hypothetical protein
MSCAISVVGPFSPRLNKQTFKPAAKQNTVALQTLRICPPAVPTRGKRNYAEHNDGAMRASRKLNILRNVHRSMHTPTKLYHSLNSPSRDAHNPSSLARQRNTHRSMRIPRETCIRVMVDPTIARCALRSGPRNNQAGVGDDRVLNGPFSSVRCHCQTQFWRGMYLCVDLLII